MAKASPARSRKTSNGNGNSQVTTTAKKAAPTATNLDESIRRRAYEIYEQEGCVHGRDQEHWLRAEAEVAGKRTA
jgi:hypothetical protein